MKLWAMKQAGLIAEFGFDLDVQAEVFESCAYHYHLSVPRTAGRAGDADLGRRRAQNYNLQPEPGFRRCSVCRKCAAIRSTYRS